MAEQVTQYKTSSPPVTDVEKGKGEHVDTKPEKRPVDADEAMQVIDQLHGEPLAVTIDEPTNKRLLRTIDWQMMPLMCMVYGMNYLDSMFCLIQLVKFQCSPY